MLADPPVLDIMISTVFCFLLLLADLLEPPRGHSRNWKASDGPQNCDASRCQTGQMGGDCVGTQVEGLVPGLAGANGRVLTGWQF